MPKLQVASPTAWGLERWGKARRTSSVQWPKALALYNGQWRDMATSCNHSLEMATAVVGRGRSRQLFAIGRLGPPRNEKPTPVRPLPSPTRGEGEMEPPPQQQLQHPINR